MAITAGAEFLLSYVLYVFVLCGSLACVPYGHLANRQVTGWDVLLGDYLMGMSGAVGGLLGLVVAARLVLRHSWGLSLAQGIIAMLAPFAARSLLGPSLVIDTAIFASAGAIAALLALGFYIVGSAVVRWAIAIYAAICRAWALKTEA